MSRDSNFAMTLSSTYAAQVPAEHRQSLLKLVGGKPVVIRGKVWENKIKGTC